LNRSNKKCMNPSKPRSIINLVLLCCLVGMLSSCATKIPYKSVKNQLPPIKAGYARVYFYCLQGNGIRYPLRVDGKKAGFVENYECLYQDHAPGNCKLTVGMAGMIFTPGKDLTLNLTPGETQYVQVEQALHLFGPASCRLILMDPDQGAPDLDQCYFMQSKTP